MSRQRSERQRRPFFDRRREISRGAPIWRRRTTSAVVPSNILPDGGALLKSFKSDLFAGSQEMLIDRKIMGKFDAKVARKGTIFFSVQAGLQNVATILSGLLWPHWKDVDSHYGFRYSLGKGNRSWKVKTFRHWAMRKEWGIGIYIYLHVKISAQSCLFWTFDFQEGKCRYDQRIQVQGNAFSTRGSNWQENRGLFLYFVSFDAFIVASSHQSNSQRYPLSRGSRDSILPPRRKVKEEEENNFCDGWTKEKRQL